MHRFFVEQPLEAGLIVGLSKEESAHAARVLRLKAGDPVELLDGGALYAGELVRVGEDGVKARALSALPSPESRAQITLWQGMPKADKLEWIVQKATELGVWALWPVEMERSVVKGDKARRSQKRERWERIALEAAKQSGRAHVPQVEDACGFEEAYKRLQGQDFDLILVAWEEARGLTLSRAVRESPRKERILLVIGPEGGITQEECQRLQALGGRSVTLGRRILRTETAGPSALAVILAALEEM